MTRESSDVDILFLVLRNCCWLAFSKLHDVMPLLRGTLVPGPCIDQVRHPTKNRIQRTEKRVNMHSG